MKYIVNKYETRTVENLLCIKDLTISETKNTSDIKSINVYNGFINCLKKAPKNKGWVFLEDDIILCNDFENEILKVIEKYKHNIISFFTLKNIKETKFMLGSSFCMSQCVYFPANINRNIINFYEIGIWKRRFSDPTAYDYMIGDFMQYYNIKYILNYPCLVQHKNLVSAINPSRSRGRQTKIFLDDLKDKGDL